jgi:uncharacterized protein
LVDGAVHLPTLGRLAIGPDVAPGPETAMVDVAGEVVAIRLGDSRWILPTAELLSGTAFPASTAEGGRPARWQPVRRLKADGISVALEDTDPYRDCHQWRPASRLTDAEFATWQRQFGDAWQEIERAHGAYAPALAEGLTTLMPLAATGDDGDLSSAARDAFGAVALALPADPVTFALLLIHEFQHVKLGAVLDLYDLYDPADGHFFHAPWREGKHRIGDLFQGAYAHLAVTDFWHAREQIAADLAAGRRFALCRAQTRDAIEALAAAGSLTPLGAWFVEEMRQSVGP